MKALSLSRRPEAHLEAEILLALGHDTQIALYKNPVGQGYYGTVLPQIRKVLGGSPRLEAAVLQILYCNRVTYGLGVGSPDLVGIGRGGVFIGLELKSETGRARESQLIWHEAARARGARVEICKSVAGVRRLGNG